MPRFHAPATQHEAGKLWRQRNETRAVGPFRGTPLPKSAGQHRRRVASMSEGKAEPTEPAARAHGAASSPLGLRAEPQGRTVGAATEHRAATVTRTPVATSRHGTSDHRQRRRFPPSRQTPGRARAPLLTVLLWRRRERPPTTTNHDDDQDSRTAHSTTRIGPASSPATTDRSGARAQEKMRQRRSQLR